MNLMKLLKTKIKPEQAKKIQNWVGRPTAENKQTFHLQIGGKTIKRSSTNYGFRYVAQIGTDEMAIQFHPRGELGKGYTWYTYRSAPGKEGTVAKFMKKALLSETGTPDSFGKIFYHEIRNNPDIITKRHNPGTPMNIKLTTRFGLPSRKVEKPWKEGDHPYEN